MGSSLSACNATTNGCDSAADGLLGFGWWPRVAAAVAAADAEQSQSRRFSAEVYKLSADQRQWVKVHPDVLSLRVRPSDAGERGGGGKGPANGTIALLEATTLTNNNNSKRRRRSEQNDRQRCSNANEDDDNTLFSLPIPKDAELKRYTEKFVYWRDPCRSSTSAAAPEVFALNVLAASDVDHFCAALHRLPPTPFLAPKCGRDELAFEAHIAPLMALHRDRVEECPTPLFTKCRISLRESDATVQVLDEHGHQLLARMSATECIFCMGPSTSSSSSMPNEEEDSSAPSNCQLSVSFPARALLFQFPSYAQQVAFCRHSLNASSASLAGSLNKEEIGAFLRARLNTLRGVLSKLNSADQQQTGLIRIPNSSDQAPMFLCDCDPTVAMRRRQSMFALLHYALSTRIAALDEQQKFSPTSSGCLEEMLASAHLQFAPPLSSPSSHHRLRHHVAHRVHLRALLACRFSQERTIQLLGKCTELLAAETEASECPVDEGDGAGSTGTVGGSKHGQDSSTPDEANHPRKSGFSEIKLTFATPTPQLNSTSSQIVHVLLELQKSERAFVRDIHMLLTRFVLPSQVPSLECLRELYRTHAQFLSSLEAALGPLLWQTQPASTLCQQELKPVLDRVFTLFISKCARFKIYSEYTFAHSHFQQCRQKNSNYNDLIVVFAASIGGTRMLDSLLIKPIQRLCRYPLFLEQLRGMCAEGTEEHNQSAKALRQMRVLTNWLNEMQRIQEDYGAELALISMPEGNNVKGLNGLNSLQLFSHVRWQNPPETVAECPLNCVLFVFRSAIVVLERRKCKDLHHHRQTEERMPPLVLPIARALLILAEEGGGESKQPSSFAASQFALALLPHPPAQPPVPSPTSSFSSDPASSSHASSHLFHFECCHPAVCRHLNQILLQRPLTNDPMHKGALPPMMSSWRMETSIESSCSSSSDRGYVSNGANRLSDGTTFH